MITRIARLTALALALALVAPSAAIANQHEDLPLLFSGETDEGVWMSHRVTTNGATVASDIEAVDVQGSRQVGGVVYDEQNHLVFSLIGNAFAHPNGVYLDVNVGEENVNVDVTEPDPVGGHFKLAMIMNPEGSPRGLKGTFKVLLWYAGAASRVTYTVRGEEGAAYHGSKSGDDTFTYTSRDFSGTANVSVGTGGQVGARANMLTSRVQEIEDTFVGSFSDLTASADLMSIDGPRGSQDCDISLVRLLVGLVSPDVRHCIFWTFAEDDPQGEPATAGTYTFRLSGIGAGGGNGEVLAAGADVRIPVEADLELAGLEVTPPTLSLGVGEEAQVAILGSAVNHGPWAPMDASLLLTATPAPGVAVAPEGRSVEVPRLGLGEVREVEGTLTIRCKEPGIHTVGIDGRVRPAESVDIDLDPANAAAESSLTVSCS